MGADYKGQEQAIEELSRLSDTAKEYLCHHIINGLYAVNYFIEIDQAENAEKAVSHIIKDLDRANLRPFQAAIQEITSYE